MKPLLRLSLVTLTMLNMACTISQPQDYLSSTSTTPTLPPPPGNNGGGGNTGANIAACNRFSSGFGLEGKAKDYIDSFGAYRSDWIRVKFTAVPPSWLNPASGERVYVEFFRGRVAPASSSIEIDPTPLQFRIEDNSGNPTHTYYFSDGTRVFDKAGFLDASRQSDANKLTDFVALVGGTDSSLGYQILQVVLRKSTSAGVSTLSYSTILLPHYEANPNVYSSTHVNTLNQLHPFWSIRNDGWTSANYLAMANQFCF